MRERSVEESRLRQLLDEGDRGSACGRDGRRSEPAEGLRRLAELLAAVVPGEVGAGPVPGEEAALAAYRAARAERAARATAAGPRPRSG